MKLYIVWLIQILLCSLLMACGDEATIDDLEFDIAKFEDTILSIPEDTPTETLIGALNKAANTDFGDSDVTISFSGDSEIININNEGQVYLAPGFSLDYETRDLYRFTVTVELEGQNPTTATLRIDVTDVQEGPRLKNVNFNVDEDIPSSTLIGSVIPQGVNDDAFTNFNLTGNDANNFDIRPNGDIKLALLGRLDADINASYSLTLTGTNSANETSSMDVAITVNHVSTVPLLSASSLTVNENSAAGKVVGQITIDDDGGSNISAIELTGLGAGGFNVDAQGEVTVSGLMKLDYESFSHFGLEAIATNTTGDSIPVNLNIQVLDLDVPPTLQDTILSIQERAPEGSYVGSVIVNDVGESAISSFTLRGNAYNHFSIDNNGIISIAFDNAISTATRSHYSLTVFATNQQGDSNTVSVTVNIESLVDDNSPKQLHHLVHSYPVKYDFAGNALALLDQQLYVGIKQHNYATTRNPSYTYHDAGSVSIYSDIDSATFNEQKLKINDNSIAHFNQFGSAVSVVNNTSQGLLVGVGIDGGGTTNVITGLSDGQIRVYKKFADDDYRDLLSVNLSETELAGAGGLGHSIALGDDYFISGVEGGTRGVFLFSYDAIGQFDGSTGLISKLRPSNLNDASNFGENISLDGNYFVVSSNNDSTVSGIQQIENTGAVYLYKYNPITHTAEMIQHIQASDGVENDFFGNAVSISGDHIAIANAKNSVYVFKINNDDTVTESSKITHEHTQVITSPMASVAFKDNLLIAGVPSDTVNFKGYAGSVHIYALEDNSLIYKHSLTAEFPEASASFGDKLAFDGRYLAVSTTAEDNNSISGTGAVYVYDVKPDVLPIISNYQQDILLKDNAPFDNLYEFEAESPQGGPFTYTVSGQDADKFILSDNRLMAISAFDTELPEDSNEDNIYELIITLTDSSGISRAYTLQVTVWQHQLMYYRSQHYSEVNDGSKYGVGMRANHDDQLVVLESIGIWDDSSNPGRWRDSFHYHIYNTSETGELVYIDSVLAPETSPGDDVLLQRNTYGFNNKGLAIVRKELNAIDVDGWLQDEHSVLFFPLQPDGSLGAASILEMPGSENVNPITNLYQMGDHLIVKRQTLYSDSISNIFYTIDDNGIAERQVLYSATYYNGYLYSENFYCGKLDDGSGCRLNQLNKTTHQLEFLEDLSYADTGYILDIETDKQTGLDYMLTTTPLEDKISLQKFDLSNGQISFVNSIIYSDYETHNGYLHNSKDLIISEVNGYISIFQFNLLDDSLRYLGSIYDNRLDSIDHVVKIGNFIYFSNDYGIGGIYIYELDPDL